MVKPCSAHARVLSQIYSTAGSRVRLVHWKAGESPVIEVRSKERGLVWRHGIMHETVETQVRAARYRQAHPFTSPNRYNPPRHHNRYPLHSHQCKRALSHRHARPCCVSSGAARYLVPPSGLPETQSRQLDGGNRLSAAAYRDGG